MTTTTMAMTEQEPSRGRKFSILENVVPLRDSFLVGACLPQTLLGTSTANWNLSGQSPSILLRKTVRSLKSPTGAFIVPLRSTNANLSGQSPSILLRKTVRSLKSSTGAFIVPLRSTNANLSGQSPSILLCKTVLSLKSPTGAFIVLLRSTNANLYIKENIDETVFMFALFKRRKSDKGRN